MHENTGKSNCLLEGKLGGCLGKNEQETYFSLYTTFYSFNYDLCIRVIYSKSKFKNLKFSTEVKIEKRMTVIKQRVPQTDPYVHTGI